MKRLAALVLVLAALSGCGEGGPHGAREVPVARDALERAEPPAGPAQSIPMH